MGFPKAVQNTHTQEYLEYLAVLIQYKKSCSEFTKISRYKLSLVPAERLAYYDKLELHKEVCKAYHAARDRYASAQVAEKLKDKGIKLDSLELAQTLGVKIPLSMRDMIEKEKQAALARSITPEQFEIIAAAAKKHMEETSASEADDTAKNQFLRSTSRELDFTEGFDSPFEQQE